MDHPKVSVIMPVYGVEKYIARCARSLFGQTLDDIEFIFVNDCTPDNSIGVLREILEEYPRRKDCVTVYDHPVNRGLAVSRIDGIHLAKGEYIIACDSDDWVESTMYELMYNEAIRTDADIVGCDYLLEYGDRTETRRQDFTLGQTDMINEMLSGGKVEGYIWNRMVRRSFYVSNGFKAPEDVSLLEDMAVTVPMHLITEKVAYVGQPLYHYNRSNIGSLTAAKTIRSVNSELKVFDMLAPMLSDTRFIDSYRQRLVSAIRPLLNKYETLDVDRWRRYGLDIPAHMFHERNYRMLRFLAVHNLKPLNRLMAWGHHLLCKAGIVHEHS